MRRETCKGNCEKTKKQSLTVIEDWLQLFKIQSEIILLTLQTEKEMLQLWIF